MDRMTHTSQSSDAMGSAPVVDVVDRPRRRPACRPRHRGRGIEILELTIALPLMLLFIFGLIEYGWIFTKSGQITNASRQGVRIGVRPNATNADVTSAIDELMQRADLDGSGYAYELTPADVSQMSTGQTLTVSVSVPYDNIALTGFPLVPVPDQLKAEVTMSKEGP